MGEKVYSAAEFREWAADFKRLTGIDIQRPHVKGDGRQFEDDLRRWQRYCDERKAREARATDLERCGVKWSDQQHHPHGCRFDSHDVHGLHVCECGAALSLSVTVSPTATVEVAPLPPQPEKPE